MVQISTNIKWIGYMKCIERFSVRTLIRRIGSKVKAGYFFFVVFVFTISYLIVNEFLQAGSDVLALGWSHQQIELINTGTRAQQLLDQHFAHESRGTGDKHRFTVVKLSDTGFFHFLFVLNFDCSFLDSQTAVRVTK